ncbi:hypothetical protein [Oceanisphaera sp. IT1-181]|uniref:hypothetical protein n=1 Tax=Oceanisphaera sp. IT1-181 TaxID=3081199 RepID=UPI0029C9F25F|nr:hypothetical protein [Oceanisphaera sp. IT1-181]
MNVDAFSEYFGELKTRRNNAKIDYSLFDLLFFLICDVIPSAEDRVDILARVMVF